MSKPAVCLSDICNIVSIFKFDHQLSHSNERVGSRDETDKKAAFLSQWMEIMNQLHHFHGNIPRKRSAVTLQSFQLQFEVIMLVVLLASSSVQRLISSL